LALNLWLAAEWFLLLIDLTATWLNDSVQGAARNTDRTRSPPDWQTNLLTPPNVLRTCSRSFEYRRAPTDSDIHDNMSTEPKDEQNSSFYINILLLNKDEVVGKATMDKTGSGFFGKAAAFAANKVG
jgi:hypothetical protein